MSRSWKSFCPENCPSIPAVNKKLLIHTALSIEGAKQKRIEKSVRFCFYGEVNYETDTRSDVRLKNVLFRQEQ